MEHKSSGTTKVHLKLKNKSIEEEEDVAIEEEEEDTELQRNSATAEAEEEEEEEEQATEDDEPGENTNKSSLTGRLTTMMISSSTSTPVNVGSNYEVSPGGTSTMANNTNNNTSSGNNNNNANGLTFVGNNNGNGNGIVGGGGGGLLNGGSPDSTTHSSTGSTSSGFHSAAHNHRSSTSSSSSATNNNNNNTNTSNANQTNMYSLKWNTQLLALQRSLANLWDNGIGTDAVLLCQGVPLPVHKIILTAASPYVASVVQTMVTSAHMMPVIVLDISAEAGKALLSFLYCGEAHVPVSIIPQLVTGAKFLGISGFGEPGVLESLTGMVPDHETSSPSPSSHLSSIPEKSSAASSFRSTDSPCFVKSETNSNDNNNSSPLHHHHNIPQMPLPVIPSIHHVQIPNNNSLPFNLTSGSNKSSNNSSNSKLGGVGGMERSTKNSSPYPSQQYIENLIKNGGVPPGATITKQYPINHNTTNNSPKKTAAKNRVFIGGGTSILDNLLKNPKGRDSTQIYNSNSDSALNLSNSRNKKEDYEAQGYAENAQQHGFYYSSGQGHFGDESMDQDGDDNDNGPIPAQLLEPNVEYHIGNEFTPGASASGSETERFRHPLLHANPLIDLAKVASTMHSIQPHLPVGTGPNKRRGVPKPRPIPANVDNGLDLITSTAGRHSILDPSSPQPPIKIKIKKAQEPIICEICNKKFSNAYNLRVHMEGHSGQVFVCSVCSHASRSRDALRKHFAYRHRELWISGMSAFRKNVPGRKLSISKPNNGSGLQKDDDGSNAGGDNEQNNNNNTLPDSKNNYNNLIRGGDGTLTISEAFPVKSETALQD